MNDPVTEDGTHGEFGMDWKKKGATAAVVLVSTLGTAHVMQSSWVSTAGTVTSQLTDITATSAKLRTDDIAPEVAASSERPAVPILAATTGHVVPSAAAPMIKAEAAIVPVRLDNASTPPVIDQPTRVPEMPEEAAGPTELPMPGPSPLDRLALTSADPEAEPLTVGAPVNEFGMTCGIILSAAERPASMVNLSVTAPCRRGERITIRHEGLIYSAVLDGLGMYAAEVPALARDASFNVSFLDGTVEITELTVSEDADLTERVVLQFNGPAGLQIHALEFGADYGTPGHVWSGNARSAEAALNMGGGYVTMLGDPSLPDAFLAEVYTLPSKTTGRDGVVRLNVEAEVSPENCDKTIAGETLQRSATGEMNAVSLTLSMPTCDAVGEFLVLKNLLRDLKIASN